MAPSPNHGGVVVVPDQEAKAKMASPVVATKAEDLPSKLQVYSALYTQTRNKDFIALMQRLMDDASPEIKFHAATTDEGYLAFICTDSPLSHSAAGMLMAELKKANPAMADIPSPIIQQIHEVWRKDEEMVVSLPRQCIAQFLEICSINWPNGSEEEPDQVREKETVVLHAISAINVTNKHNNPLLSMRRTDMKSTDYRFALNAIANALRAQLQFLHAAEKDLIDHHGGSVTNIIKEDGGAGIQGYVDRLSNAVDVATCKLLWQELSSLHAVAICQIFGQARSMVEGVLKAVDELTVAISE